MTDDASAPPAETLRLESILAVQALLLLLLVGAAWLTRASDPLSVAAGGALMAANVWVLKTAVGHALRPGGTWRRVLAIAVLVGKLGLLLAVVGLLFWRYSLDGMGFVAGMTSFLVAAVAVAMWVGQSSRGEP